MTSGQGDPVGKSLNRVRAALAAAGAEVQVLEMAAGTRTAAEAAAAAGCEIDQIVKSIVFRDTGRGVPVLFLTAGGNRVDPARAAALVGAPVEVADAALIRATTGFAISGVAPIGHLSPIGAFFDPRLTDFPLVWAAAGTPHHIFAIPPNDLFRICGAQRADFAN